MSYQDNMETIKTQIVGEGKFLEYFLKLERFYRKYKFIVGVLIAALILFFAYSVFAAHQKEQRMAQTTKLYEELLANKSAQKEDELKALSPALYKLYALRFKADEKTMQELAASKDFAGKIAAYSLASMQKNSADLTSQRLQNEPILKDISVLQTAYFYMDKKDYKKASDETGKLSFNSQLKPVADIISHYGILWQKQ